MKEPVATCRFDTQIRACVFVAVIAIIAVFHPIPDETITAAGRLARTWTLVVVSMIAIIAIFASLNTPIATMCSSARISACVVVV